MNKLHPWLYSDFKKLITSYQTGYNHHALLIHAISGMNIDMLIYAVSCFIMCEQPGKYKKCNKCQSCQLMIAQTHPDYHTLTFNKSKDMTGVDAVRDINRKIYEHSRLDGVKIIWLQNITQFTKSAVNALLKILEEPPKKTWFLISCHELDRLPMVLRSRCRLYHLRKPNENLAISWLSRKVKTVPLPVQLSVLRLCGGAPEEALLHLQPEILSQRNQLCNMVLSVLKNNNWFSLLKILNQEQAIRKLFWLSSLLLDTIKIQQGITLLDNVDVLPLLNILANHFSNTTIQNILYEIFKVHKYLSLVTGLNQELMLIDLLLYIEYIS